MYVLFLVACTTFGGQTHCQTFERAPRYETEELCRTAEAVEKGRYARRRVDRAGWLSYRWRCESRAARSFPADGPGAALNVTKY